MKKIGLIAFIFAIAVGVVFANVFNFGHFGFKTVFGGVQGSGVMQTEKRSVAGFKSIKTGGAFQVEVVSQKDFDLEIEADDNLLPFIKTEVSGDTLRIYTEGKISTRSRINVKVAMPDLEGLDVSGASNVNVSNVKSEKVNLEASGASKITINGEVKDLDVDLSGASKIDAENLRAENVRVDASGASKATVFAANELTADASGASKITYTGDPKEVESKNSGAASVKRK